MTDHERYQAMMAALEELAENVRCGCMPYRGGSTASRHWSTCQWATIQDVFDVVAKHLRLSRELAPVQLKPEKGVSRFEQ